MTCNYHDARVASRIIAPTAQGAERQGIMARIMEITNTSLTPEFTQSVEMNLGVSILRYTPGKPARMPTPNNPGDPEEPEEIEIAVLNEDGEEITSLVPEDVFENLRCEALEYMRERNQ